jgi:ubiquinol-cytochrome c reductase cytochrome b subunit
MGAIKRIFGWLGDRTGLPAFAKPILDHPVPPNTGWWYVFGTATLTAFIVQVITGIALSSTYVTSTSDAYNSLQFITHDAPFGSLLRGMHNWGAGAMVLLIGIHMARTFLMGAYKFPREMNWLSGSLLLLVTLAMAFTGQLLRWDQNAVWSTIVAAEQAGRVPLVGDPLAHFILAGDTVGGATLSRFFSFHVFFIPALIFALLGLHLFLVLRNGISEPPRIGRIVDPKTYRQWYHDMLEKRGVPFWPDAAWRDVLFGVGVILVIAALAVFVGPPELGKPPDPTILQAYPRPDWYFLWYFSVLALIPPAAESFVIVGGPLLLGFLLFILPLVANKGERSPTRRPWAIAVVLGTVIMVGTLWIAGEQATWSPSFAAAQQPLPQEIVGTTMGPVYAGSQLFVSKGCVACHALSGTGGQRGPDLTTVGSRLSAEQLTTRILNGGNNMPAYGSILTPGEVNDLVAFLSSRK